MAESFNLYLVAMSYAVSVFGAYAGLVLAGKITDLSHSLRYSMDRLWLACAAVALGGAAIWSMHFIGMLAYKAPVPVGYDPVLTMISMAVAVAFTGVGLYLIVGQRQVRLSTLLGAGTIMGLGVAGMHYTGMAGMVMAGTMHHDPLIVGISVVIAIVASTAALWIAFTVKTMGQQIASAFIMGLAVCGMHYTAMYGVRIVPNKDIAYVSYSMILANELAGYIIIGTFMVLATSLLATFAVELSPSRAENR